MMSQIGGLVVINLVLGFGLNTFGGNIDNFAHLGGLAGGLWLGLLIPPIGARELPILGHRPGGGMPGSRTAQIDASGRTDNPAASRASVVASTGGLALSLLRWAGVGALVVVVFAAVVLAAGKYV